ncbi:hypothetical protein ACFWVC_29490 [Streptomyces sp. NPDC058691]|uniref:hypothetical protein n=1 Tax=Streptomyces sp. NPDC058691 TaxID=3346601 RepID=UPI00364C659C
MMKRTGIWAALTVALSTVLFSACAQHPAYRPRVDPAQLIISQSQIPDTHCGARGLKDLRQASSVGEKESRGSKWWTLRSWEAEHGCEVSMAAYSYPATEDAENNFTRNSPQAVYGSSWPSEPTEVDAPTSLGGNKVQILCLGGNADVGCSDWIYWARYGDTLVNVEVFDFATPGIRLDKETFLEFVGIADRKVVNELA